MSVREGLTRLWLLLRLSLRYGAMDLHALTRNTSVQIRITKPVFGWLNTAPPMLKPSITAPRGIRPAILSGMAQNPFTTF